MTCENDWVLDPFLGVGTAIVAAIRHKRRGAGAEVVPKYAEIARGRIEMASEGTLRVRPMTREVFDPKDAGSSLTTAPWLVPDGSNGKAQLALFERPKNFRAEK
jgi:adenine-specific DNA-methyltransferase